MRTKLMSSQRLTDQELVDLFSKKMGWGSPFLPNASLQTQAIFSFLLEASHECNENTIVLDISAGQCRYKPFFQHAHYIAVDSCVGDKSWDFSKLDAAADSLYLPIKSDTIDICTNFTSMERYPEPSKAFSEIFRVLKPGGKLYLYVPFAIGEHQTPYDFFRYTRYGLARLCEENNLNVNYIRPTNSIFETAFSMFSLSIDYIGEPEIKKKLLKVKEELSSVYRDLENRYQSIGRTDYPDDSQIVQFPLAYCLCAIKPKTSLASHTIPVTKPTNEKQKIIEILRKSSQYELALQHIGKIKYVHNLNAPLIGEIIRVILLTENYKGAIYYFNLFKSLPEDQQVMDTEVFLRLMIDCPSISPSVSLRPSLYPWCEIYMEKGIDTIYKPKTQGCQVITDGFTRYQFTNVCQSCKNAYSVLVSGTLLIKKSYLCPFCLAKQIFSFKDIKDYVTQYHAEFIGGTVLDKHMEFRNIRKKVNLAYTDNTIPMVAGHLGQETLFTLNHLIVNKLLSLK
jgi:SAM-dependent methyltransferase